MLGKEARDVRRIFVGTCVSEFENSIEASDEDDVVPVMLEIVVASAVAKVVLVVVNVLAVSPSNVSAKKAGSDSESGSGSDEGWGDG